MARIVVIGAGMGGLSAALRLAAAQHEVVVCEASEHIGGKLGQWRKGGFAFDIGPSLVTMPQVFSELFSDVGERLDDHLSLVPVEPLARYRWSDGTQIDTSGDADLLARQFRHALGPHAAADWRRLMDRAERMWRAVEQPVLRTPSGGPWTFAPLLGRVGDLRQLAPRLTLRDLAWRYLRDPRQRMMLDRYATYTGSDPRRAPAALLTIPYAELAFGGWYVEGGLHRLAEAVAALAVERGAHLRLATPVTGVRTRGSTVAGVQLASGEMLRADVVVANVDAQSLYAGGWAADEHALLAWPPPPIRDLRSWRLARARRVAARAPASLSGFVLLLGVEGATHGLAHHNVLFPTDYDAEFDALFGSASRPVGDPTIYISRPLDAMQAPAGSESWFVLVNAPRHAPQQEPRRRRVQPGSAGTVDWDAPGVADAYASHIIDVLAGRGLDIRHRIVVQKAVSPAALERATGAPGGAIYGSSSNGPAAAFLRAANRSPVRGLYLVGGSAHPGGGLPLVTLSAAMVADLIGPP